MKTEKEIEDGERALQFLEMQGYRRCNIPACNCPFWHGGNASERLTEIHTILEQAGLEPHRKTAIVVVEELIKERESFASQPAFPVNSDVNPDSAQAGMRLRDFLASQIIGAVIASVNIRDLTSNMPEYVAHQAYRIADEMIKARSIIP